MRFRNKIAAMLEAQEENCKDDPKGVSGFDMKQSTMPDVSMDTPRLFEGVRPTLVTDEGETMNTFQNQA